MGVFFVKYHLTVSAGISLNNKNIVFPLHFYLDLVNACTEFHKEVIVFRDRSQRENKLCESDYLKEHIEISWSFDCGEERQECQIFNEFLKFYEAEFI